MGRRKLAGDGPVVAAPTKREKAEYIHGLLRDLRAMAEGDDLSLLAHLIRLAEIEAAQIAHAEAPPT